MCNVLCTSKTKNLPTCKIISVTVLFMYFLFIRMYIFMYYSMYSIQYVYYTGILL